MRTREKIILGVSIVSLVGLLISILSFYSKIIPKEERSMPLFIPADCIDNDRDQVRYSICEIEKNIKKKRKMNFILDGNKEENERKLDMIRYEALKLKFIEDTSTVILVNFTNDAFYADFVSLINICIEDKHKHYHLLNDKFVIFEEKPKRKVKENKIYPVYS